MQSNTRQRNRKQSNNLQLNIANAAPQQSNRLPGLIFGALLSLLSTQAAWSLPAKLTPEIVYQPNAIFAEAGRRVVLHVSVYGDQLAYQWQKAEGNKWKTLEGSNQNKLVFPSIRSIDAGAYRVVANNDKGVIQSKAITVNVKGLLKLLQHPKDAYQKAGASASFSAMVIGTGPFDYTWMKGNQTLKESTKYVGVKSNRLTVTDLEADDHNARYRLVIRDPDGQQTVTRVARLNVENFSDSTTPNSTAANKQNTPAKAINRPSTGGNPAPLVDSGATVTPAAKPLTGARFTKQSNQNVASNRNVASSSNPQAALQTQTPRTQVANQTQAAAQNQATAKTQATKPVNTQVTALKVNQHPKDAYQDQGSSASFLTTVTGEGPFAYQWFKNNTPLQESTKYVGTSGDRLTITDLTRQDHGSRYKVVIKDAHGQEISTRLARLNVSSDKSNQQPVAPAPNLPIEQPEIEQPENAPESVFSIAAQPAGIYGSTLELNHGETISLNVKVAGAQSPVKYAWLRNNKIVSRSSSLTLKDMTGNKAGTYRCRVTSGDETLECADFTLKVAEMTLIVQQPVDKNVVTGQSSTLDVRAEGTGTLRYQWQRRNGSKWANISNAKSTSLTLSRVGLKHAGYYRCVITNERGVPTASRVARLNVAVNKGLKVQPTLVYGNEHSVKTGSDLTLNVEANDGSATYRWYAASKMIHEGPSLVLNNIQEKDANTYRCRAYMNGFSEWCNPLTLNVTQGGEVPRITSETMRGNPQLGSALELLIKVESSSPTQVTWYKDDVELSEQNTLALRLSGLKASDAGSYYSEIRNSAGKVRSKDFDVVLSPELRITKSPSGQVLTEGNALDLEVAAQGKLPLLYTWFKNGARVKSGTDAKTFNITAASDVHAGNYQVLVTDADKQTVKSDIAQINVIAAATETPVKPSTPIQQPLDSDTGATFDLTWSMPLNRANGEPLAEADIHGYRIHIEDENGKLVDLMEIRGAKNTEIRLEPLPAGAYMVSVSALDNFQQEGQRSQPMAINIE